MSFQPIGALLGDVPVSTKLDDVQRSCEQHGTYISSGLQINIGQRAGYQRWSGCPGCAALQASAERRAIEEQEAKELADRMAEQLGQTAIPERFVDRTLDNYVASTPEMVKALKLCRYYVDNFEHSEDPRGSMLGRGVGLIFAGKPGTGKTHLGAAILRALLPRHVGVYATFMGMMNMIRATYDAGSKTTERQVLERLRSVPLLVVDEIGVQRGTDDEHVQLFGIMDERYARKLPTIVITNQDLRGLRAFVGDRLMDRLNETTRTITFDWDSHRKPGGA